MDTLLEAIQAYPDQFISTCRARANTTPNAANETNHLFMAHWIKKEMWDFVADLLIDPFYRSPLEGVVFCLDRYSEIDNTVWHQIVVLLNEEKFV